jgi:integrase
MKADLEKKVNIDLDSPIAFKLKDFRATFCQQSIDRGADAPAVSIAMGHASTKTTETYYGRMRTEKALVNINTAWSDASDAMCQNRVIDKKYEPSGYA